MPDVAASLPFVPPGAMLTASGRQALSLVAQDLRARGITDLLAPAFHCVTMIEPFQLEGLHVELIAVAADLLLDPHALAAALPTQRPAAILHSETAGHLAGPALADTFTHARTAGHLLILDETHSFLDKPLGGGRTRSTPAADYRVASLRKWLPLPDGAWVTGVPPRPLPRHQIDDAVTSAGLVALAAEAGEGEAWFGSVDEAGSGREEWLRSEAAGEDAGELWRRTEDLVDRAIQPAAMSPQARALLSALDAEAFLRRHRAPGSPVPFHWPRPQNLPAHIPLLEDQDGAMSSTVGK
ncbi:MAG: hypothetical protein EOL89_02830 [Actinobacteria bacterium]|nr:hypothetical protein [Actinomycetota bacterium]